MSLRVRPKGQKQPKEKPRRAVRILGALFIAGGTVWHPAPARAASATATFQVTARIAKSCTISQGSLSGQVTNGNETLSIDCGATPEAANSQSSATSAGTDSPSTTINYGVSDFSGPDGDLRIITIHF